MKSAVVFGIVIFVSLFLVVCGSKIVDKFVDFGLFEVKEFIVYVDEGYKSYIEEVVKVYEKEIGVKVIFKIGDVLGGFDKFFFDN